jgi:hypothetical protein
MWLNEYTALIPACKFGKNTQKMGKQNPKRLWKKLLIIDCAYINWKLHNDVKRSLVKEVKVLKQKVRKYNQEINED